MNKKFKKYDPNEIELNIPKKFYFYQNGKDTYLVSSHYYPINCPYFNLNGRTLKELIEEKEVFMSDNEDKIKQILWKHLK